MSGFNLFITGPSERISSRGCISLAISIIMLLAAVVAPPAPRVPSSIVYRTRSYYWEFVHIDKNNMQRLITIESNLTESWKVAIIDMANEKPARLAFALRSSDYILFRMQLDKTHTVVSGLTHGVMSCCKSRKRNICMRSRDCYSRRSTSVTSTSCPSAVALFPHIQVKQYEQWHPCHFTTKLILICLYGLFRMS